jgi:hypothetical protein
MRVNYIKGILVLICSLAATLGFSRSKSKGKPHGVYLNLGMYNNGFSDLNEGLGKTEDSDVKNTYNTTLGYIAGNGFMIFGKYYMLDQSRTVKNDGAQTSKVESSMSSYGLGLGWQLGSFYLAGSYMLDPGLEQKSGGNTIKYENGSGMLVDVGFIHALSSHFWVGPQITWSSFTTSEQSLNGTKSNQFKEYSWSEWMPQLVFTLSF